MTAFTLRYAGADGKVVGSGKEMFVGCRDTDRNGTLRRRRAEGDASVQLRLLGAVQAGHQDARQGQCVHPVIGGTGTFAKAKGVIHMTDRPSAGGVLTTYTGTLDVPGIAASSARGAVRADTAVGEPRRPGRLAAASRRGCGSGCRRRRGRRRCAIEAVATATAGAFRDVPRRRRGSSGGNPRTRIPACASRTSAGTGAGRPAR